MPDTTPECLSSYRTLSQIPVQWGNMDAFGHVNNVVYIRWMETARIDFLDSFETSVKMSPTGIGPILAAVNCNYQRQLHYPDSVIVGSKCGRLGRSSMDIEHAVYSVQQKEIVAQGTSVVVVFDYVANTPVRIPEDLRTQLEGV